MKRNATLLYGGSGEETYGDAGQTVEFISKVLDAVTAIHKQHLMTTGPGSFAAHEALGDVYGDLEDFGDNIAESVMGCRKVGLTFNGVNGTDYSAETRAIYEWIEENRAMAGSESHIQNIVDDILDKLSRSLFKLDRLA
jgi:DNA-binding ferritin-like protein